ncbi:hypothetical protein MNV49_005020 [Pseudohyphozyma bogoriensis]|nr:hypothetical protein MNV49_005020 [Pseudohyphozyma bogoriensis]
MSAATTSPNTPVDKTKPYFPLANLSQDGWSNDKKASATCFCGQVQLAFPVSGPGLGDVFVCHCSDCHKITASMFATNFCVTDEGLRHVRGQHLLKQFSQNTSIHNGKTMTNHFCGECGTLMYRIGEGFPGLNILRVGTVDDFSLHETVLKPKVEQFIKDSAGWLKLEVAEEKRDVPGSHATVAPVGPPFTAEEVEQELQRVLIPVPAADSYPPDLAASLELFAAEYTPQLVKLMETDPDGPTSILKGHPTILLVSHLLKHAPSWHRYFRDSFEGRQALGNLISLFCTQVFPTWQPDLFDPGAKYVHSFLFLTNLQETALTLPAFDASLASAFTEAATVITNARERYKHVLVSESTLFQESSSVLSVFDAAIRCFERMKTPEGFKAVQNVLSRLSDYATFPTNSTLKPTPFKVSVPDEALAELKALLAASKLAPETYENSKGAEGRRYGVTREWMVEAKEAWEKNFDWRRHEASINKIPQFKVPIKDDNGVDFDIHFAALFSQKPDAIPLIFVHGWPGKFRSYFEFLDLLRLLTSKYTPTTLPYHIVVPSIPGYAFSSPPPLDREFGQRDVASLFVNLMKGLGFERYVAQGGDLGSTIVQIMAEDESCVAIHLNFLDIPPPKNADTLPTTSLEKAGLERSHDFQTRGSAYAMEQATRPATLGFALQSSPVALLAWVGEKFLDWTDMDPTIEDVLLNVSLYWFTNTIATSFYPYRDDAGIAPHSINKPFGYSYFPAELLPIPRAYAEEFGKGDLVFWRAHEHGGHFAAKECPEVLLRDVEEFVEQVWKK